MAINSDRAQLVRTSHRFKKAEDPSVLANFPTASELEIETNLSGAAAQTLANTYLAATKTPTITWEVEIDGILNLEDFVTTVNQYTVNFPLHATDTARTYKLIGCTVDYASNVTVLRLRG